MGCFIKARQAISAWKYGTRRNFNTKWERKQKLRKVKQVMVLNRFINSQRVFL